jgi:anti-sigma regulatory factor (Ser/Thr protein kinase)
MRRAIYALHEPSPSRRGLMVALRALLADCSARTGLETHLTARVGDAADEPERAASGRRLDGTSVGERVQHDHEHAPDLGEIGAPMEARVLAAAEAGNSDGDTPSDDTLDELAALPEPVGEALYRVAREALANVEKHAQAFNVWVELSVRPAERHGARDVALVVRDDGQGFRRMLLSPLGLPDEDDDGLMHFGTGNMRRDMEAVGGKVEITSVPGRGTTVRATAPIT